MTKSSMTKAALALLTASLAFGSPAWAADNGSKSNASVSQQTPNAQKQRFPDVPANHWAIKHITKLALLGIVEGNGLGQYEPSSSVTQEQVITMLVRMLGWEDEAKALPAFASDLQVSDYAKPYLHMALEKGLIVYTEELGASGAGWGTRSATREWVAKLVVKAIGKQTDAESLQNEASSFTDNASISSWALGYINEAVVLKIVNGMEDGSFKPANPVTRAEMATFLSRAGQYAESTGRTAVGIVESAANQSIVLSDDYGDEKTYTLTSDTLVYGFNQDAPSGLSAIKPGNKVSMIVKDTEVQYIEVLEEDGQAANVLNGTLVSLDYASGEVTLTAGGKEVKVQIQVPVSIVDASGKGIASSDLIPGSVLELHRTGSRAKYSSIVAKHIPVNKTGEGTVKSVDLASRKLSVLEASGTAVEYPLADEVKYTDGGAPGDLSVIKPKDKISYRIDTDLMTEITMVLAYEDPHDDGKVLDIKADQNLFYITLKKADGKPVSYNLSPQLKVIIPGIDYATYKDLEANDDVRVMLDDNNMAYQISVKNRSMKTEFLDTIVYYDADSKALLVKNPEGKLVTYVLSDQTTYDLNGNSITYSAVISSLTKGKKVDITASSETSVRQVRIVYGYEGTVVRASVLQGTLTLKIGDQLLDISIGSGAFIDIPNKSNSKLADISIGDYVKVGLDSTLTTVNRVQVAKSLLFRLVDKNAVNRQLTLKDELNNTITATVSSSVKIYGSSSQYEIALADMPLEDYYSFTYTGSSLEKITAAPVSRGSVTSVDAAGGKISLSTLGGAAQSIAVGTAAKVKREGAAVTTALADLKAGDRVEAVKGLDGVYTLYTAAAISRQADYYDAASQSLYVLRDNLSDPRSYTISSKAYIHKGMVTLAPAGIVNKDKVTLYILNGKIVEVDKQ